MILNELFINLSIQSLQQDRYPGHTDYSEVYLFHLKNQIYEKLTKFVKNSKNLNISSQKLIFNSLYKLSLRIIYGSDNNLNDSSNEFLYYDTYSCFCENYLIPLQIAELLFDMIDIINIPMIEGVPMVDLATSWTCVNHSKKSYLNYTFQACLNILSTKTILAEAYYSLFLEGIAKQRLNLIEKMLVFWKDDPNKLYFIMNCVINLFKYNTTKYEALAFKKFKTEEISPILNSKKSSSKRNGEFNNSLDHQDTISSNMNNLVLSDNSPSTSSNNLSVAIKGDIRIACLS